jgi:MFS family permease
LLFTLWLQSEAGFSPLRAGLTMVAFSVGSFVGAPASVPLAIRYGRRVLVAGAILMAGGFALIGAVARHVTTAGGPWPLVPGLVLAGLGLAFLVIPLVNVVLAAAPADAAGGASGLFGTCQQLGGAVGVAGLGTVFFGRLGTHSAVSAATHTIPYVVAVFVGCALLSLALPNRAVTDEGLSNG